MVLLNNFIHHFDFVNTFSFSFFLNNFFVKSSNEKLIPLKEYIKDKTVNKNDLKMIYEHIQNRNEYLSRFFKTSLEFTEPHEKPMINIKPMSATKLNNNQEIKYKNIIRNMFWLEILKQTKSGFNNVPTFLKVLEDLYLHQIIDYKILTPSAIFYIKEGHIASVFSSFYFRASIMNPYFVFSLAKTVLFSSPVNSSHRKYNIFTPTMGWGSYLYGFAETGQIARYVGIDIIPSVCKKTVEFAKQYFPEIETEIYCQPSEDMRNKQSFIQRHNAAFDIVFFSPPYFQLELYQGKLQSTNRYKTYEEWLDKYWRPTVELCFIVLKKGGKMCYIVSNYGNDPTFQIEKDMMFITKQYFSYIKQLPMYNKNVHSTKHRETNEKIFLFEKTRTTLQ